MHLQRPVRLPPRRSSATRRTTILHKLALDLNDNLPEIYLWQPNYLHVYTDKLGGDFAIYPNERESFQKILDWTYSQLVTWKLTMSRAPIGRILTIA